MEQLSQVLRYVEVLKDGMNVVESFIDFTDIHTKTEKGIIEVILEVISEAEKRWFRYADDRGHS